MKQLLERLVEPLRRGQQAPDESDAALEYAAAQLEAEADRRERPLACIDPDDPANS